MLTTIPAKDVTVGMSLFMEYAPGREDTFKVREVIDNEDGTFGFTLDRLGLMTGWRADEHVAVES